ncbi:hypothetical protein FNZ56_02720 [Pseudoluteimonas lycopersici]|jgi:hypothetical protein|uniref:Uncharacterized protein n=1 Tax=Pseudoluteimonas lycopersici TaxID=1324796 RepID=A0A516V2X5_9GAMM|nr:hypothetical protein [Lysobacter lycopersici]QDQ72864.1 hypothetical protein FNZ56_02720 [Lysobacter lycopersici]
MNVPNPPDSPQPDPRGSRWLGFGLFWLILVGGGMVSGIIVSAAGMLFHGLGLAYGLAGLLPWIAPLVLAIWLANKGKTRTAQGIAFGFLSLFAVGLLLVAACFGILALGGFGNWH